MKKHLFSLLTILPFMGFGQVLLQENFNSGVIPTSWTVQQSNPRETWKIIVVSSGTAVGVEYDEDLVDQNEWLITPSLNFSTLDQNYYTLKFKAGLSAYWSIDPFDHYDVYVKVSTDNGATWTQLWTETDLTSIAPSFAYNNISLDVSQYADQANVKFAFIYEGVDGAGFYVDDVIVEATSDVPVPDYCTPDEYFIVEAITNVNFAGINNSSPASSNDSNEYFLDVVGQVTQGETYEIRLSGNTEGDYDNKFEVFIDWNKNGVFDANEHISIEDLLVNSTGTDGIFVSQDITVPADAVVGNTRMRVKKYYFTDEDDFDPEACSVFGYFGQFEDYTINVSPSADLGINDLSKSTVKVYPNPVVDYLSIVAGKEIKSVSVVDILGNNIQGSKSLFNNDKLDMKSLPKGVYIVTIETENEKHSFKVVKK